MIKDEDGSVTGLGAGSWLAGSNILRLLPECIGGEARYGGSLAGRDYAYGVRCHPSAELRGVNISA